MTTKKELNNKKQYGFPDEAEIERVIKRVTQPGYRRINKGLKPDASEQDKVKYNLCQSIGSYCDDNQLSEQKLAQKLDIDQAKLEYILFCHIDKLTVEELITERKELLKEKLKISTIEEICRLKKELVKLEIQQNQQLEVR